MHIRFTQPGFGLTLIVTAGLLFFMFGTIQVVAQNYLEPTGQAPLSNVIDFINETNPTQARFGRLIVNANSPVDIPNDSQPFLHVRGNALFLGAASFDTQSATDVTWFVNPQATSFVSSGTVLGNGKLGILSTASGLYAESTNSTAISVATTVENVRSVFGQAVPPPASVGISAGIQAKATTVTGMGLYAIQTGCDGTNQATCGVAGKFEGNFVVTNGKLFADARNVYKAFSILDQGAPAGDGIGIKTIEISTATTVSDVILADETYLSMDVSLGSTPYNPNDANISIVYNQTNRTITTSWSSAPAASQLPITVQVYYYKRFGAVIVDSPGSGATITSKNFQVNSGTQYQFYARINNGSSSPEQFTWLLYKNNDFTNAANQCLPVDNCGTITATGLYTAPAGAPAGLQAYVVAKWNPLPTVLASTTLNFYTITITPPTTVPANTFYLANVTPYTFSASAQGPSGAMTVTWSIAQPPTTSIGSIGAGSGVYTAAASIPNGVTWPWTGQIRATIQGIPEAFYANYAVTPIPRSADITFTNTFAPASPALPQDNQPANRQAGTGQVLILEAKVLSVPDVYQHNFNWSITSPIGDTLSVAQTNDATKTLQYTLPAPAPYDISNVAHRSRTIVATWRNPDNGVTPATNNLVVHPGQANPNTVSLIAGASASVNGAISVLGFNNERSLESINGVAVTGIYPQTIPVTCGSIRINNAVDTPASCVNPTTQGCSRAYSLTYTGHTTTCSANIPVLLKGDKRETATISVQTTGTCGPCNCDLSSPNPRFHCGGLQCASCCAICGSAPPDPDAT